MSKDYTNYIIEHRDNVLKAYQWLVDHKIISNNYQHNIATHDISKWSNEEYDAYDKYFYGKQGKTAEVKEAFNFAWLHHIHANPHHWQHWMLQNDEDGLVLLDMPYVFQIEMICDWWAFSWKENKLDEIFSWYEKNREGILLSDKTRKTIESILDTLKKKLLEMNLIKE